MAGCDTVLGGAAAGTRRGPVQDLRDDLDFFADVRPIFRKEAWPSSSNYGRWEFIRLVMKQPPEAFWGTDAQNGTPFIGLQMWKATEVMAWSEAENGGPVAETVGLHYTLSAAEKQYLASLGVDAEPLLA